MTIRRHHSKKKRAYLTSTAHDSHFPAFAELLCSKWDSFAAAVRHRLTQQPTLPGRGAAPSSSCESHRRRPASGSDGAPGTLQFVSFYCCCRLPEGGGAYILKAIFFLRVQIVHRKLFTENCNCRAGRV